MGIGAAMTGLRPIIEGMNMGFLLLAYNQISNNAGMLHYTSGGQYKVCSRYTRYTALLAVHPFGHAPAKSDLLPIEIIHLSFLNISALPIRQGSPQKHAGIEWFCNVYMLCCIYVMKPGLRPLPIQMYGCVTHSTSHHWVTTLNGVRLHIPSRHHSLESIAVDAVDTVLTTSDPSKQEIVDHQ